MEGSPVSDTPNASERRRRDEDTAHALPKYFDLMQSYLMLPLLLASEGIINGTMMTLGVKTDTWLGILTYGCLYATGFVMGGMALRCSVKAAACFARGEIGLALFNFLGILLFALPEIWASLVSRSLDLPVTNPDRWLNDLLIYLLGAALIAITPTNLIVSLILPAVTLFWGFSAHKPPMADTADALQREELKRIKAEGRANRFKLYASAAGQAGGGLVKGAKASFKGEHIPDLTYGEDTGDAPQGNGAIGPNEGGVSTNKQTAPARKRTGAAEVSSIPPGMWGWRELQAYIKRAYGADYPEQKCKATMRQMGGAVRISAPGKPYYAPQQTVRSWADKHKWDAPDASDGAEVIAS